MSVGVFILFGIAGIAGGLLDGALSPARRRLGRIFTVMTDIATAFLLVGAFGAILYAYCDGQFFFYAALLQAVCFLCGRSAGKVAANAVIRLTRKKRKKHADPLA